LKQDDLKRETPQDARKLYEALKATRLYDDGSGMWNEYMREDQNRVNHIHSSSNQLYSVLVEMLFSEEAARELYENLKKTPLYDETKDQWNLYVLHDSESETHSDRCANDQLINILILSSFDKNEAEKKFQALKQSPLFDEGKNIWYHIMSELQELMNNDNWSSTQLLGILVEYSFNEERARSMYSELKDSQFHDTRNELWNLDKATKNIYPTDAQLLGVLVESLFNKKEADRKYKILKRSPLYDNKRKQWKHEINYDDGIVKDERRSECQLLNILIEHSLSGRNFQQEKPALPKARKF
jgi:hypothetical protein